MNDGYELQDAYFTHSEELQDGYDTELYSVILKPYVNDLTERYGLMLQFGDMCVMERDGIKFITIDEDDLNDILTTFNPLLGGDK